MDESESTPAAEYRAVDPEAFFDIIEGFTDEDGDTILLVKEAASSEHNAATIESMFEAFEGAYVFVLPEAAEVSRVSRERVAASVGLDLSALARARQEYANLLANPGEGHLRHLGAALDRVWSYRDPR